MKLSEATVLVVDDEPALREIFAKWLVAVGCGKVHTAADGLAALAVLEAEPIDLLITDLRMPVMDGVTLVRRLMETGASLPSIVFISGFGDVDRKEMYALGVEAFIAKPFDREELLGVLERALAERASLWLTPMPVVPRQTMQCEACCFGGVKDKRCLRLGRGGFSAHYAGPLSVGRVAFRCLLASEEVELAGEGYVRWRSKTAETAGIEFVFLEPSCRAWLLEAIAAADPRSFIPE